ncbi:MAG: MTH1187 family thiamine-binding protein [Deltaproteobacteria bacterium]|nr:MTH1187 family thiamine-binding protein [Deltaproteobacteria bacterium]
MKVIADICVVPLTGKTSVRAEVKRAHQILVDTGLTVHLHAYGTNIEGDYDVIFAALKKIHEELHRAGVPRISTNIRLGSRTDKDQGIADKLEAVLGKGSR